MNKATRLSKRGFDCIEKAINTLKNAGAVVFFDVEDFDCPNDEIYEFPYAYYVTKHAFYLQGHVSGLDGEGYAHVHMTGEDWGEIRSIPINELPVESIFELLKLI